MKKISPPFLLLGIIAILVLTFMIVKIVTAVPEDKVQNVNKEGTIETQVSVIHLDSIHDILLTTHNVWVNNNLVKTIINRDTVPFLGMTITEGEDANGNTTNIQVKKDYEIYITVK